MNTGEKLEKLFSACKGSVTIAVNDHRDCYLSVEEKIHEIHRMFNEQAGDSEPERIPEETKERMIEKDRIVNIHFYPNTPIGFYSIYEADIGTALDRAIAILESEGK